MTEQALTVTTQKEMERRIEKARFLKDLTPEQRSMLAEVAIAYGLDPMMGELIIYEGRPYPTAEGLVRVAHRSERFAGLEDRPMTSEEKAAYGYTAPVCWIAKVYRSDWRVPAVGTGTADAAHPYRGNLVEPRFPQRMARVRAIRQALKLAFPNSLPFQGESAEEMGVTIDRTTGEILNRAPSDPNVVEAEAVKVVDPDPAHANGSAQPPAQPTPTASANTAPICTRCNQPIPNGLSKQGKIVPAAEIVKTSLERFGVAVCQRCGRELQAERDREAHEAALAANQPAEAEQSEGEQKEIPF